MHMSCVPTVNENLAICNTQLITCAHCSEQQVMLIEKDQWSSSEEDRLIRRESDRKNRQF